MHALVKISNRVFSVKMPQRRAAVCSLSIRLIGCGERQLSRQKFTENFLC